MSNTVFISVISAVVASIVMAVLKAFFNYIKRPRFVLKYVADDRAVFSYRGVFPIEIGGSRSVCDSGVLYTADGARGTSFGIIVKPNRSITLATRYIRQGQAVSIVYRRYPLRKLISKEVSHCENEMCVINVRYSPHLYPGWKIADLELQP